MDNNKVVIAKNETVDSNVNATAVKIAQYVSALVYNAKKINVDQDRIINLVNAEFSKRNVQKVAQDRNSAKIAAVLGK